MIRNFLYEIKKSDSINFAFANILISLISVSTFVLLSNFFSKDDFGLYQLLISIIGAFYIFNLSGFDIFISRQILSKDKEYFIYVLRKIMPISLVLLFLTSLMGIYFFEKNKILISLAFFVAFFQIFDKYFLYLEINQKFKIMRYLDFFNKISILFIAIFSIIFSISLNFFLILFSSVLILFSISRLILQFKELNPFIKLRNNYSLLNKQSLSRNITIGLSSFALHLESIILGLLNPSLLSIYAVGVIFPAAAKNITKASIKPLIFKWLNEGQSEFQEKIFNYFIFLFLFGLLIFSSLFFISDFAIKFFFPKYLESIWIAKLMSVPLITVFVTNFCTYFILYDQNHKIVDRIERFYSVSRILLCFAIVPTYGIYGAVLVVLLTELSRQFFYLFFFFSNYKK